MEGARLHMSDRTECATTQLPSAVRVPARRTFWRPAAVALRTHWPEYLMEAAELGIFMVSACAFTVAFEHPASPLHHMIRDPFVRRFLVGMAMACTAAALIYSAWGQRSGAHMNPAVTLTFLRLKKVAPWDAAFYVLSQFVGAIAGVMIAAAAIGSPVGHPAVNYAATLPGSHGSAIAFAAELLISFFLFLTVLTTSNNRRLGRFTGLFAAVLIACYIAFEAPFSGMSMNPARTFGSALSAHAFRSLWIYFIAPPVGMLLAAELYVKLRSAQSVYCAKLNHHNSARCIFACHFAELAGAPDPAARS